MYLPQLYGRRREVSEEIGEIILITGGVTTSIEMVNQEEDSLEEKPRSRRVARTCPNCTEGGER
jgi:hypothetical protein